MIESLGPIFLLLVGLLSLVAFMTVMRALFPARLAAVRALAGAAPGRAFLVGFVNFVFFGGFALALLALSSRGGDGLLRVLLGVPAFFFLAVLAAGLSFGLSGMAQLVGLRLLPESADLRQTIWGALALGLACLLPFLGWFLLLPYAALLGLGAFILGLFSRAGPASS